MKRIVVGVLLLAGLFLFIIGNGTRLELWNFNSQQEKAFAQFIQNETMTAFEKVLTLHECQPLYMKETKFVKVGELQAKQPVALIGEDEAYYELQLGKMSVFVRKGKASVEKRKLQTVRDTERMGAVKTFKRTIVYEAANLQSKHLMHLEKGYRYPVVKEVGDWYSIKIGERLGYIYKTSVELDEGVPVLVYHQVIPRDMMSTMISTVSVENFEQQMRYLSEQRFKTLTSKELYDYLEGRSVVPSKAIVITFDDGLLSSKEYAYPVLKKHGFTAPHHMISSRMRGQGLAPVLAGGKPLNYLTSEDLLEIKDVFQFEAHTDALHQLTEDQLAFAYLRSKEQIVADLKSNLKEVPEAISIAYPYGQYNEEFIEAAREIGLLIGYTTIEGYANMSDSNYEVRRFGMSESRTDEQFVNYVNGDMTWR